MPEFQKQKERNDLLKSLEMSFNTNKPTSTLLPQTKNFYKNDTSIQIDTKHKSKLSQNLSDVKKFA